MRQSATIMTKNGQYFATGAPRGDDKKRFEKLLRR